MENQGQHIVFTRKQLTSLVWPLLLEQFLGVSMGFADTFMVSGVSEAAISSVSLVDSLNVLILQILAALASGGAVIVSQYLGCRDERGARHTAAQLYVVLGFSTLTVMIPALIFSRGILRLIFGSINEDVMAYARIYLWISAISYPFMGFYNAGAALFRAQGNSRISMYASLVMNLINITGNAILIYGLKMEVLGAALATLAGRVFAALWVLAQHQHAGNPLRISSRSELRPNFDRIKRILAIGIPSGMENGMFQIGKLCVSSLTSTLGTAAIAANAVAGSITTIATIPGNTMSLAMIPVVGRCIGAGDKKSAKKYALLLLKVAMAGLLISNVLIYLSMPILTGWFHLSAEAAVMCRQVITWFCVFCVIFWPLSFTLPNALRSGGDAPFTMIISILSMWLCRVLLSYFFVLKLHMGLTGVWFGMFCDWIVRDAFFIPRFIHGKWMDHKVI